MRPIEPPRLMRSVGANLIALIGSALLSLHSPRPEPQKPQPRKEQPKPEVRIRVVKLPRPEIRRSGDPEIRKAPPPPAAPPKPAQVTFKAEPVARPIQR